jgi:GNAT superfamily N-acetyltransferase
LTIHGLLTKVRDVRRDGRPSVGATALPHEVRPPAGEFFVAYLHGEPIGCGAVKHHADAPAEIKRMWIAPPARGLGLGRRFLETLEAWALAGGARVGHIETSAVLSEALALYRSAGWLRDSRVQRRAVCGPLVGEGADLADRTRLRHRV